MPYAVSSSLRKNLENIRRVLAENPTGLYLTQVLLQFKGTEYLWAKNRVTSALERLITSEEAVQVENRYILKGNEPKATYTRVVLPHKDISPEVLVANIVRNLLQPGERLKIIVQQIPDEPPMILITVEETN